MIPVPSYCMDCVWFKGKQVGDCSTVDEYWICPAFPNGIPPNIAHGRRSHGRVVKGHTGDYVFLKRDQK